MNLPKKKVNNLKNLKCDPEIILIQTHKLNKLFILNTNDYNDKMLKCIKYIEEIYTIKKLIQ